MLLFKSGKSAHRTAAPLYRLLRLPISEDRQLDSLRMQLATILPSIHEGACFLWEAAGASSGFSWRPSTMKRRGTRMQGVLVSVLNIFDSGFSHESATNPFSMVTGAEQCKLSRRDVAMVRGQFRAFGVALRELASLEFGARISLQLARAASRLLGSFSALVDLSTCEVDEDSSIKRVLAGATSCYLTDLALMSLITEMLIFHDASVVVPSSREPGNSNAIPFL